MTVYPSDIIFDNDGGLISLHHVESIRPATEEQRTLDKLKGDATLVLSMVSGKEYSISMLRIKSVDARYANTDCNELMLAIADRWKHIFTRP